MTMAAESGKTPTTTVYRGTGLKAFAPLTAEARRLRAARGLRFREGQGSPQRGRLGARLMRD
jgi:hypothetical protein